MSREVRLEDRVKWTFGRCQVVLNTPELLALNEVMLRVGNKRTYTILINTTTSAAQIADKAIANMISSADFHP